MTGWMTMLDQGLGLGAFTGSQAVVLAVTLCAIALVTVFTIGKCKSMWKKQE